MRDRIIKQIDLQEEIQRVSGINIVNCGGCGSILLHRIVPLESNECADITCPYCEFTSDPCDFPDFFYRGMEDNYEFSNVTE